MKLRDLLWPADSSDLLIHVGIAPQLFRTSLAQIVRNLSNTAQYGMRAEIIRFQSSDVVMCTSRSPLGCFGTPALSTALRDQSDRRFTGPSDGRELALSFMPLVAAQSYICTAALIPLATSAAVSMDGATVNR